jgi:hypothetical protein
VVVVDPMDIEEVNGVEKGGNPFDLSNNSIDRRCVSRIFFSHLIND